MKTVNKIETVLVCTECGTVVNEIFNYETCDGWSVCPDCGAVEQTKEIEYETGKRDNN